MRPHKSIGKEVEVIPKGIPPQLIQDLEVLRWIRWRMSEITRLPDGKLRDRLLSGIQLLLDCDSAPLEKEGQHRSMGSGFRGEAITAFGCDIQNVPPAPIHKPIDPIPVEVEPLKVPYFRIFALLLIIAAILYYYL